MKLGSADLSNVRADPEETFNGERRKEGVCACGCVYYCYLGNSMQSTRVHPIS